MMLLNYLKVAVRTIRRYKVYTFINVAGLTMGMTVTALKAPYSVVITQEMAEKYFGDEDPIGKTLKIGGATNYAVSGVVADVPANSHFRFHMARSFETLYSENRRDMENWLNIQYYTYLLLSEWADAEVVEHKLQGTGCFCRKDCPACVQRVPLARLDSQCSGLAHSLFRAKPVAPGFSLPHRSQLAGHAGCRFSGPCHRSFDR
jgi:hypothetical protein